MLNDMERFYIFLDVDGVFWDFKSIKNKDCSLPIISGKNEKFTQDSIVAVNKLIKKVAEKYIPEIVVISLRCLKHKNSVAQLLYDNGLTENCELYFLEQNCLVSRIKKIKDYLEMAGGSDNYIIIDDRSYCKRISGDKLIRTSIWNKSLNSKMVDNYFEKHTI